MKASVRYAPVILGIAACLMLAGCSKKRVTPYGDSPNNAPEGKMIQYAPPESGRLDGPAVERLDQNGMDRFATKAGQDSDAYKRLHGRSSEVFLPIYFDFDQSSVRPDQKPTLEKNAQYLQSNPTARIVVEGNCDDRGTNEYNIALGERRAVSAKNYLVGLGISAQRVRTTSFGEERPLFMGTDEESYSLNRRDDFVLE